MDRLKEFNFHAQIRPDKLTVFTAPEVKGGPDVERVRIEGWASTAGMDRDLEVVEPDAVAGGISNFMKNPVLLYMHNPKQPIGAVTSMKIEPDAGFWIEAILSAANDVSNIVTKIKEGILRAFSIGFRALDGKLVGEIWHITKMDLWEVSIVSIPANADALFSLAKGIKWGSDLVVPAFEIERIVSEKLAELNHQRGEGVEETAPAYANLERVLKGMRDENQRAAIDRLTGSIKELKKTAS